jgi:hypothetical protein
MVVNNDDLELCLLAGYPIETEVGKLYPLKLKDIVEIGLTKYNEYLGITTFDINDIDLDDINLVESGISTFEFILLNCHYQSSFKDKFIEALSLFFKEPVLLDENGSFYIGEIEEEKIINNDNYEYIQDLLMKQNYLKKEKKEEYNFANDAAREFYEKNKKNKKNAPKVKSDVNLHSIVSGIAWKSNSVNIFDVWNLTIYQTYDAIQRMDLVDNYEGHLGGIFAGTIDPKKMDFKKINWSKKLN